MTVKRIMKDKVSKVISAAPGDSISSVAARLARHHIGALVVLDETGGIAGVIAEGDVMRAVAAGQAYSANVTAQDIMRPCVLTCTVDMTEAELFDIMCENHIHHVPVMNGKQLVGIVSLGDLVRLHREKIREMAADLERLSDDGRFTAKLKHHRKVRPDLHLALAG